MPRTAAQYFRTTTWQTILENSPPWGTRKRRLADPVHDMDVSLLDLDPFDQRPDDLTAGRPGGRFQPGSHSARILLETLEDRPQTLHTRDPLREGRRFRLQLG